LQPAWQPKEIPLGDGRTLVLEDSCPSSPRNPLSPLADPLKGTPKRPTSKANSCRKDLFGSDYLGTLRAESGIFEDQGAAVTEGDFFGLTGMFVV
jgi:hypothetical protein